MPTLKVIDLPEEMTVAEGLNELKRIYSLVMQRANNIRRYSSRCRKEPEEIDNQQDYINGQRQSAEDLIERYLKIKTAIQIANNTERIRYTATNGKQYDISVAEGLLWKQPDGIFMMRQNLLQSFNIQTAQNQIMTYLRSRQAGVSLSQDELEKLDWVPHRYYDERAVMDDIEGIAEFKTKLDYLLDASNHRTVITI